MLPCPRCAGPTSLVELLDEEARLNALQCMICGWIGGEPLIDLHHGLAAPPEPRRAICTPVYDPTHRRLIYFDEARSVTDIAR